MAARIFSSCLPVVVLLLAHAALAVRISPDGPSVSVPYNASGTLIPVAELPFNYSDGGLTTVKTVPGCAPEQVSLTYYGADARGRVSILVSWATCDAVVQSLGAGNCTGTSTAGVVNSTVVTSGLVSKVLWRRKGAKQWSTARGTPTSYVYQLAGAVNYASPVLHHVLIAGLTPGEEVEYTVVDNVANATQAGSRMLQLRNSSSGPHPYSSTFKVPGAIVSGLGSQPDRSPFPLKLGVIGDPGQTYNTSDTLRHLADSNSDLILIVGDLSYADRPDQPGVAPAECNLTHSYKIDPAYQPRWDMWGRLVQPLFGKVPILTTNGNHELETLPAIFAPPYNTNFTSRNLAYNARYPVPQAGPTVRPGPRTYGPVTPQPGAPANANASGTPSPGAYRNLYYSSIIPGVATIIALSSYSPYDVNGFSASSEQMTWLKATLAAVDRQRTPWLIVLTHAPLYNTYSSHFKENECFRQAIEELLFEASVDLVLLGHCHAYERTRPVYNYQVDQTGCAPMHITIGDGGNVEGVANEFVEQASCTYPPLQPLYQPQTCVKFNEGPDSGCADGASCYCYSSQPTWSAFREPSFGHGELELLSATQARWTWYRNQDQAAVSSDTVNITRLPSCSARRR